MTNTVLCTSICIKDPTVIRWYMDNGFDDNQFAFEQWLTAAVTDKGLSNTVQDINPSKPTMTKVDSGGLDTIMQDFCAMYFEETGQVSDIVDMTTIKRMYDAHLSEKGYKSTLKYQTLKDKLKTCFRVKYTRTCKKIFSSQRQWDTEIGRDYDMTKFPTNDDNDTIIDVNGHFSNLKCKTGPCVVPVVKATGERRKRKLSIMLASDDHAVLVDEETATAPASSKKYVSVSAQLEPDQDDMNAESSDEE